MRGYLKRVIQARPRWTALLIALAVPAAAVAGLYWYVSRQWDAAQAALHGGRPAEARSRLEVCLFWWPWSRSPDVHRAAARAARLTGDYTVAESHLQRCIKLENGATEGTQLEFLLMRAQTGEEDE